MENYQLRTQRLLSRRLQPIAVAIEEDDANYLNFLLQNQLRVPPTILIDIFQNGWSDQYVMPLIKRLGPSYFTNPMEAAVYAEKATLISEMVKAGIPVTKEAIVKAIEEDNDDMLLLLLPDYQGDPESLLDIALSKNSVSIANILKEMGFSTTAEKVGDKCEKDENGNVVDPITFDVIPPHLMVAVPTGDGIQCFSIATLYQNWKASGKFINPYNRQDLPQNVIDRIKEFESSNKVKIPILVSGRTEYVDADKNTEIGQVLLDFNAQTSEGRFRGRQNLDKFYLLLPIGNNGKKRIYEYDLTTKLDSIGLAPGAALEAVAIHAGAPGNVLRGELYSHLYAYLYGRGIPWADNHIPDAYMEPRPEQEVYDPETYLPTATARKPVPPPPQDTPGVNDAQDMMTVIATSRNLNALAQMVQQKKPKILSYQANFISDQVKNYIKDPNVATKIQHLVYSRVVDKQNLLPNGVAAYYILNLYQQPDYKVHG